MARRLLLLAVLLAAGCKETPTQILLTVRFPALELDGIRVEAKSASRVFPSVRRPDPAAGLLTEPQSIALLLPDEVAGHELELTVAGLRLEQVRATATARVIAARGESVPATVWLSRPPPDAGGDLRRDRGPDLASLDLPRPDRGRADLAPDARRDGLSCSPGAFLGCQGALLERCSSSGNGSVTEDCAPFACNASAARCNECDPGALPLCVGSNRVTCSAAGLKVSAPCPLGCAQGSCCTDVDGDQVSSCAGDCDDGDPDVHPGQLGFFAVASKGAAGFDYNCDKASELELPSLEGCARVGASCTGHGWQTSVPGCGQTGTFITCKPSGRTMCSKDPTQATQRCR